MSTLIVSRSRAGIYLGDGGTWVQSGDVFISLTEGGKGESREKRRRKNNKKTTEKEREGDTAKVDACA